MASHKFSVGQIVDFGAHVPPARNASGPYMVTRVLPADDVRSQRYRIKSKTEVFERTANEYEIALAP